MGSTRLDGEGALESIHRRAGREIVAFEYGRHRGDVVVLDALAPIGKKRLGLEAHAPLSVRSRFNPASFSHSVLVFEA